MKQLDFYVLLCASFAHSECPIVVFILKSFLILVGNYRCKILKELEGFEDEEVS